MILFAHARCGGRLALQHAQAFPDNPLAPELLFLASDNYQLAGNPQQAAAARTLLIKKYPTSPFARKIQSP